jgi:putative ABC transport system substrate-binding protein
MRHCNKKRIYHTCKPAFGVIVLCLALLCASSGGATQLSVLISSSNAPYTEALAGLQERLGNLGDDPNYEIFDLDGKSDEAELAVQRIINDKPDIIITFGTLAFKTAVNATDDIPIVAGVLLDKEKIKSYPNATGVVLDIPLDVQFTWMRSFFPKVKNIGVLYNPGQNQKFIQKAKIQAHQIGFNLIAQPVPTPSDLPNALQKMVDRVEVLWAINDQIVFNHSTAINILLYSFRNKIPLIGLSDSWAKAGAYYALDRNYSDIGAQCGEIVNKILQGTSASNIPQAFPRDIMYSLNIRTAKKMRLQIEQNLIKNAQNVY